jgi:hypothetical protein
MRTFTLALLSLTGALALVPRALAQSDPASLPARDQHEGLLMAADPVTDPERARKIFGKKTPLDAGIVPIEVIFRNGNHVPILLNLESLQLRLTPRGGEKQQLAPLAVEDVIERMLYKGGPDVGMPRRPIPGRPPRVTKDKDWKELEDRIRPLAFEMNLVPPKGTARGYFFFHVGRRANWQAYAQLYLPELRFMHNKQPLFFFEVDLSKAAP